MTAKMYISYSGSSQRSMENFLQENIVPYTKKNVSTKSGMLLWEEFLEILTLCEDGVEDILSTNGKSYKMLVEKGINFEELKLSELYEIILAHGTVLKSPLLIARNQLFIGYEEDSLGMLKSKETKRRESDRVLEMVREVEDKNDLNGIVKRPNMSRSYIV